jgi:hypothetical protein
MITAKTQYSVNNTQSYFAEIAIVNRDLSWLCARPEKFRSQNSDRPFITRCSCEVWNQQVMPKSRRHEE